ncbi:MAG: PhzF family phenazine biosynthesis protein [Bryobacteraceae bacterium]|jgi:trans-2,3-dihydro-3-hydroxyanthranilate isomerase
MHWNRRKLFQLAGAAALAGASRAKAQRTPAKSFDFVQVDVFTTNPLEGNPLCVFPQAQNLSDDQMMAITRELNHSETTFIQPSAGKGDAVVRIFTLRGEVPFAGHPTLGTAFVMAQTRPGKTSLLLEEKVGPIPVTLAKRDNGLYLEMKQNDPTFGPKYDDSEALAKALGLTVDELDRRYTAQVVSTGSPFLIVPLKSARTLERLTPESRLSPSDRQRLGAGPYYLVTGEDDIEARLLNGASEDPATGSAAGCAASFMVQYGNRKPDTQFTIHQGRFVKRPSMIYASASLQDGRVSNVRVGGYVVEVMRGKLEL